MAIFNIEGIEFDENRKEPPNVGAPKPGVKLVQVDKVYAYKTDSGSVMLQVEATELDQETKMPEGQIFYNTWLISAKTGGPFWENKTGKKIASAGLQLLKDMAETIDKNVNELQETDIVEDRNGKKINAKAYKELVGKQMYFVIQTYDEEYNGEIKTKIDIKSVLPVNADPDLLEKWRKWIEKYPHRALKNKQKAQKQEQDDKTKKMIQGW